MPSPERKRLRLRGFDYSQVGAYFVTVCARDRACLFGAVVDDDMRPNELGSLVQARWLEIPRHFPEAELDALVVMPNHLHGVIVIRRAGHARPLRQMVGSFKAAVSRDARSAVWQRSFHDRVIRNDEELAALRQYVVENPLRWAVDREFRGTPERR